MKRIAQAVSLVSLIGTILPPILFVGDRLDVDAMRFWMLVSTIAWFAATPMWMERES